MLRYKLLVAALPLIWTAESSAQIAPTSPRPAPTQPNLPGTTPSRPVPATQPTLPIQPSTNPGTTAPAVPATQPTLPIQPAGPTQPNISNPTITNPNPATTGGGLRPTAAPQLSPTGALPRTSAPTITGTIPNQPFATRPLQSISNTGPFNQYARPNMNGMLPNSFGQAGQFNSPINPFGIGYLNNQLAINTASGIQPVYSTWANGIGLGQFVNVSGAATLSPALFQTQFASPFFMSTPNDSILVTPTATGTANLTPTQPVVNSTGAVSATPTTQTAAPVAIVPQFPAQTSGGVGSVPRQ